MYLPRGPSSSTCFQPVSPHSVHNEVRLSLVAFFVASVSSSATFGAISLMLSITSPRLFVFVIAAAKEPVAAAADEIALTGRPRIGQFFVERRAVQQKCQRSFLIAAEARDQAFSR